MWRILILVLVIECSAQVTPSREVKTKAVTPLPRAHAHNDYEHSQPLFAALDLGFCSIEADIWLVDGQLLVAHDREKVNPKHTLQALYLDPLRQRIQRNNGRVYAGGPTCTLLIDVKSDAASTYAALREVLQPYATMLTEFTPTNTTARAVTVILSGNRAAEMVVAEPSRLVALDGRLTELTSQTTTNLYPLISDNWQSHFTWRGEGSFPEAEQQRLRELVRRSHEQGRRIRFLAAPDFRAGWRELQSAGVDLIGTDDLVGLADFLRAPKR